MDDGYLVSISHLDKYSQDTAERFANVFKEILVQFLDKENLGDINYTSKEDIKLLNNCNQNEYLLDYDDILDAFNDNLARYPDNKLVSYNDKSYSYAEGAYIAKKIADNLLELDINVQDCVSFLVERSEHYLFCVLGILSVGGIYVPLDDDLPDERIDMMLNDTKSKVIVVSDETSCRVKDFIDDDVVILNISEIVKEPLSTLSMLPVVYCDVACILYTSGTTGIPKGVKVTRKSLLNVSAFYAENYGITNDDVYAMFSTIGFDAGSLAISTSIYSGSSLAIVPDNIRLNMDKLNKYFIEHGVTHTMMTTQVGKLFMQNVDNSSLDVLLVGGEKLGKFEDPKNYHLVDGFGPTETFAFISSINNSQKIDSSSIGNLNYNTKAYVLDHELRQVPIGAVGELYISGYQVADGYLNNDKETKYAFLNNPFDTDEQYNIMYRTGDMVRILPDKSLAIIGRSDNQVKIRGNRVELAEIEFSIRNLDIVDDVTVQVIKHESNNELVAFVVSSVDINEDKLKENIKNHIIMNHPEYMVPSFVIKLDTIPLTINGKVDKMALPDVDLNSLHAEYVAPTTENEKLIVDAFEVAFNQKSIGLNDDFVRLGGDSITAIRVISLLEKNNISCTASDILNYKTPYLIAKQVNESVEKVSYDPVEGVIELLPIQKYFFNQINENNFTQEFILKASTDLDLNRLQKSFDELCNFQDMLRVVYKFDENKNPIQEVLPVGTCICEINEHFIDDNFKEAMKKIFIKSIQSIDISDKLMDVNLIHYNGESYLIIVIHHLIIDGISWNILISELTYIYIELESGNDVNLKRNYSYKNWIDDVKYLVENISNEEKQHWIEVNNILDDSSIKGKSIIFNFNVDVNYDVDNLYLKKNIWL